MTEAYSIPERRGLPNWVAAMVIMAALAGAVWFAWTNLISSEDGRVVAIREGPNRNATAPRRAARPRFAPTVPEGVARSAFGRSIYARVGNAALRGIADNDGKAWEVVLEHFDERTWVTPDVWRLVEQTRVAMSLPHRGKEIGLTTEQQAKLNGANKEPQLTQAEQAKVIPLFAAWHARKADRQQINPQLLAAAGEMSNRYRDAARAALLRFAAEIPKVLNEEQIKMLKEGTRPPKTTTRPVI